MQAPVHPGLQPQQGMQAAPAQAPAGQGNPYFRPSVALEAANEGIQSAQAAQAQAQAAQAQAAARKAQQEAAIMQQSGLGSPQQQQVSPAEAQVNELVQGMMQGAIAPEAIQEAAQKGELDPAIAQAALGTLQEAIKQSAPGLGAVR
jgi:hypothetical protein